MTTRDKRRLWFLGAASLLATGGIVWLAVTAFARAPQWAMAATVSPMAVRCIALIAGGMGVLGALVAVLVRSRRGARPRARALHADQGGTAAIEMAFVFPLALMIFLTITQAALLFNGNMVVHYAAFAAARMATVVVPMDINDEYRNLVYGPQQGISEKREMIRRAAVLALVPISARLETPEYGAGEEFLPGAEEMVEAEARKIMSLSEENESPGWIRRVAEQYAYADGFCRVEGQTVPVTQIELAPPDHWQDGNPDPDCPYRHHRRDEWTMWGWDYEPYCPYYHRDLPIWDYWYWEYLDVTLTYQFLLEVPYASRFLGRKIDISGMDGGQYAAEIVVGAGPKGKAHMGRLSNEGGPELRPKGGARMQPMWQTGSTY